MKSFPEVFCIIDTETTGMKPEKARIIDIGIIRVEHGKVVDRYETYLNPDTHIPFMISNITGIGPEDLEDAPRFYEVAHDIKKILDGAVFVAHNVSFDYGFIKEEFKRAGISYDAKRLCSVQLSRALYPEHRRHNLDEIINRHAIKIKHRHRAMPDAQAVLSFFKIIEKSFSKETIRKALEKILMIPLIQEEVVSLNEESYLEETVYLS